MTTIESLFQRKKLKDAKQLVHLSDFAGLNDLQAIPDVTSLHIVEQENTHLVVTMGSTDGYTIQITLRNPEDTDFQSNTAKLSEAQANRKLIFAEDIAVKYEDQTLHLLAALRQKFPAVADTTIALEANSSHISQAGKISDVYVRNMLYASRERANVRGNSHNSLESKSISLDTLPHSDLSLFFLVHELIELSLRSESYSEKVKEAAAAMWSYYETAKNIAIKHGTIDHKESWQSIIKNLIQISFSNRGSKDLVQSSQQFTAAYGKYRLVEQIETAEQERVTNNVTVSFLSDFLPGISGDASRLAMLQKLSDIATRGYDQAVQHTVSDLLKRDFFVNQQKPVIDEVEDFLTSRTYSVQTTELDTAFFIWKKFANIL